MSRLRKMLFGWRKTKNDATEAENQTEMQAAPDVEQPPQIPASGTGYVPRADGKVAFPKPPGYTGRILTKEQLMAGMPELQQNKPRKIKLSFSSATTSSDDDDRQNEHKHEHEHEREGRSSLERDWYGRDDVRRERWREPLVPKTRKPEKDWGRDR